MVALLGLLGFGRELFGEDGVRNSVALGQLNCTGCHAASLEQGAWILPKRGPNLAGLEKRVNPDWLRKWLANPSETVPGTTMPDLLHGLTNSERAGAVEELTHYLLGNGLSEFRVVPPDRAAVARGEGLYHQIGCVACHGPMKGGVESVGASPLPKMAEKWSFKGLQAFLLHPHAVRPSGRMPKMHLTEAEAFDLAHYLLRETKIFSPLEATVWHERVRSLAELDSTVPASTTPVGEFSLEVPGVNRRLSIRLAGWILIDRAGDYTFHLAAEGATRISVDGQWAEDEDAWERESTQIKSVRHLELGWHAIKVDFVRRGGNTPKLVLEWEGPGVIRGKIPAGKLRADKDLEKTKGPALFVINRKLAEKGRIRFGQLNCQACHGDDEGKRLAPPLARLDPSRGCLAEAPGGKVPDFALPAAKREALRQALVSINQVGLKAPAPAERVRELMASFQCSACHARDGLGGVPRGWDGYFTANVDDLGDEGRIPPKLDGVGNKLQADWLRGMILHGAGVIGGGVSSNGVRTEAPRVRTYMNTRMPQFTEAEDERRKMGAKSPSLEQLEPLAKLFIALDRHAEEIKPPSDGHEILVEAGRRLTGTDGLSCIGCHRFNQQPAHALQLLDLTTSAHRLNEDWFRAFLRDPNRFHPGTRMPAFWPGGVSPLVDVLGGDLDRQFAGLWAYFAEGDRAKFPEGLSRKNMELIVGGETVVYRGKLWEGGFRGIATGFPGGLNGAFDSEEMRLALLWRGRFLNASPHWSVQGMDSIRPLGTEVVIFSHGSPLAILGDRNTPWPVQSSKSLGMKFRGVQLDATNRPTFLYAFDALGVEDLMVPREASGHESLHRTIRFNGSVAEGCYFRVATGRLSSLGKGSWRIEGETKLTLQINQEAILRGKGGKQELLVPISHDGKTALEIDYVW